PTPVLFTADTKITANMVLYPVWDKAVYIANFNYTPQATASVVKRIEYGKAMGSAVPANPASWVDAQNKRWRFESWQAGTETITSNTVKQKGDVSGDTLGINANWIQFFNINTAKVGHGSITASHTVDAGNPVSIGWQADPGYHVASVTVNDKPVADNTKGQYTQVRADKDVSLVVLFEKDADVPSGETAETYEIQTVNYGGDPTVTLTPCAVVKKDSSYTVHWDGGQSYRVTGVVIDGSAKAIAHSGSYTFECIAANHKVEISFEPKLPENNGTTLPGFYTITTARNEGGKVTETSVLPEGSDKTIDFSADTGYSIGTVEVDGQPYADWATGTIHFDALKADHKVVVYFKKDITLPTEDKVS
ncbi:MAG: hypothetical protein RR614_14285, partial [Eubacterium sp.]